MTTERCLAPALLDAPSTRARLVATVAPLVFRTDLEAPGYVLLDLGANNTPARFRGQLIDLGQALAEHYRANFGPPLRFVSVSRFDQPSPTRPHRDGGPDASLLLLGYEPTAVASRIYLLDYTRAAVDRDQTPGEFLDGCNPAFAGNANLLASYTHEVEGFDRAHYQVLIVNNSCLPYVERHRGMLGVLHQAVLDAPNSTRSRPVNSLLLGIAPAGLDGWQIDEFVVNATAATASSEH